MRETKLTICFPCWKYEFCFFPSKDEMQSCFSVLLQFITKENSYKNGTGGKKNKIVSFSQALLSETIQTAHWDWSGEIDLAVSLSYKLNII